MGVYVLPSTYVDIRPLVCTAAEVCIVVCDINNLSHPLFPPHFCVWLFCVCACVCVCVCVCVGMFFLYAFLCVRVCWDVFLLGAMCMCVQLPLCVHTCVLVSNVYVCMFECVSALLGSASRM